MSEAEDHLCLVFDRQSGRANVVNKNGEVRNKVPDGAKVRALAGMVAPYRVRKT